MVFQTQCPSCGRILKLKSEAAIGRKAPCPGCRTPFVVEPYEEAADGEWDDAGDEYSYDYSDDEYGDYTDDAEEYDEVEPAPTRSSRRSGSKSGSKKKKKKAAPAWLAPVGLGLAVVLALGLVGSGVYMIVARMGGGGSNVIDLTWLPADADMYLRVRPAQMWNAPILAPLKENPLVKNAIAQAGQNGQLSLQPEEIESVTMAAVNIADRVSARVPLFGGKAQVTGKTIKADPRQVAVLRVNRDVASTELESLPGALKKTHGSAEYFLTGRGQQAIGMYLADARTLILGTESEVTRAIDRGPTQDRVSRIDFADSGHQLVVVMAPANPLQIERPPSALPAGTDRLNDSINSGVRAMALGLDLNQSIDLAVRFDCFDGTAATNLQADIDAAIAEVKSRIEEQSGSVPEPFQGLVSVATQAVASVQSSASGSLLAVSGSIPGSLGTEIQKLAENPMAALMLPALMNAGGAGPGMGSGGSGMPSGQDSPGASLNEPPAGYPAGSPDAPTQADIDAVQNEKQDVLNQLGNVRGRIKSTTGQIQEAVPGGK